MRDLHKNLDKIWNNAKPCKCLNDNKWEQDIKGSIVCRGCRLKITDGGLNNNE
jgi:hypothetical protein